MIAKINNITFRYDKKQVALDGVTFEVGAHECVGIIGGNGAGKSTLLKSIVGLVEGETGYTEVEGVTLNKNNLELIRKSVGYVFQDADSQLFMPTVEDDIAFGPRNYGVPADRITEIIDEVLAKLGIGNLKSRRTTRLSGGEKKLVSLATVLALNPKLLIFDEPTIALDPGNRRRFINVINEIDTAKIIASHDLDMIWDTCSRVILLSEGKLVASGPTKTILSDKELLESHNLELPLRLWRE